MIAIVVLLVISACCFCVCKKCFGKKRKGDKGKGVDLKSVSLLGGSYKEKVGHECSKGVMVAYGDCFNVIFFSNSMF